MGPREGVRVVAGQAAAARRRRPLARALVRRARALRAAARASAHAQRGARGAPRRAHQAPEVSRRPVPPLHLKRIKIYDK